ncbi:MAG: phospholipid scramblase-related protein [Proteobacteria bacterium]|nr:phospholipid scramblase-related protein [Pseudomonadota bacterium]
MGFFRGKKPESSSEYQLRTPTDLSVTMSQSPRIVIKQKREIVELFLGFETRNQYLVFDHDGAPSGTIVEQGRGFLHFLKRLILKSHRPFCIKFIDATGKDTILLHRKFHFFFSHTDVSVPNGPIIGSVRQKFSVLNKVYDLTDQNQQVFARISSSRFKIWTFAVRDLEGQELARISKKWAGAIKEFFTDSDNFLVDFGNYPWSPQNRSIIAAAAICADFDFFENNDSA